MSASAAGQKLVIVGASGMVGGYALRYALDHPVVERVTAIGRRKLGILHPKLTDAAPRAYHERRSNKSASGWNTECPSRVRRPHRDL